MRSSRSRILRPKREQYWSTVLINQDSVDSAAVSSQNLVDRDDWTSGTTSFERGGRLERIRGNISGMTQAVTTAAGAVWFGIVMVNDDETTPDPSVAADYLENDFIWTKVITFTQLFLTSVGTFNVPAFNVDIDVKARRKLTSQSIVLLVWRATGGSSDENFTFSAVIRSLTSAP